MVEKSRLSLLNNYAISGENLDYGNLRPLEESDLQSWWDTVPGARHFIKEVFSALDLHRSVALHLAQSEAENFINILQDKLRRRYLSQTIEIFDYDGVDDIEIFVEGLTEKYAPNFLRDFTVDEPMADLAEQNVLTGYIIIVRLNSKISNLSDAVADFNSINPEVGGSIIFVTAEDNPPPSLMRFSDYLTPYDVQFFAITLLEDTNLSPQIKLYTATLVAKLAGSSAILAKNFARIELFMDGEKFIKKIIPSLDEDFFYRAVWECQIQFLLPIVEEVRGRIIEKYKGQLKSILPVTDAFGALIEDPYDLELGMLFHHGNRNNIFSIADSEILKVAHVARNLLAHLEVLTRNSVENVFALAD